MEMPCSKVDRCTCKTSSCAFSSPGQSPGRAIVLPLASALALASAAALVLAKC